MNLEKIYQSTILSNSRDVENKRSIEDATGIERGHNPSCGDDLTLLIKEEKGVIVDASFVGHGCAISSASTNMLIKQIKGQTVEMAKKKLDIFFRLMKKEDISNEEKMLLGEAQVLEFVAEMPARIKCATLSWHALNVILDK